MCQEWDEYFAFNPHNLMAAKTYFSDFINFTHLHTHRHISTVSDSLIPATSGPAFSPWV